MSEEQAKSEGKQPGLWQRFLDNPWLLLVLGIVVPTLSYTVWGLVEWFLLEPAALP
ncbi:MAG: hypothetical protein HPKKFMNG_02849 [Planctomycetes bacterium]|nr:hypothetical protein [Planctomycetota bacterium]HRJ79889.1 hypothetical protein [Planctomycetota bacterium]